MRSLVVLLGIAAPVSAAPLHLTYRYLHVGRALGHYDVTTYSLDLDGAKAELVIERKVTDPKSPPNETGPYLPQKPELYKGAAKATKDGLDLDFEHATDTPFDHLSCHWKTLDIAGADAVRVRTPGRHGECDGDRGVFSPAKTKRMNVLSCGPDDQFVFADAGVERAALSEECYIQGAGLRAIAADHTIRRVSPKR